VTNVGIDPEAARFWEKIREAMSGELYAVNDRHQNKKIGKTHHYQTLNL
jgi:hypothetical protein